MTSVETMERRPKPAFAVATWVVLGVGLVACDEPPDERAQAPEPTEAEQTQPSAEPTYEEVLQRMSDRLAAARSLTVRARRHLDGALTVGTEAAEDADVEVAVRRPNHVRATSNTGESVRHMYFDGQQVTVFAETENMYATEPVDGSIDDLVARLSDRFGFTPPLSEFIVNQPIARIRDEIQTGTVGGVERIEGRECRQLQLRGEESEAELWVGVDDSLPCRLEVTFTEREGRPEMRVQFHAWNLAADIPDDRFVFEAPEDAIEIEMVPIAEVREQFAQAETE